MIYFTFAKLETNCNEQNTVIFPSEQKCEKLHKSFTTKRSDIRAPRSHGRPSHHIQFILTQEQKAPWFVLE